jgi:hypothetical protein
MVRICDEIVRGAFPKALWAAAVMLAREHGVYETARALRINYGALKAHVERAEFDGPHWP